MALELALYCLFRRANLIPAQAQTVCTQLTRSLRIKASPKSVTKPPKVKKLAIPVGIKVEVWRQHFQDKMTGRCFCCADELKFEDHQCGHILAEAHGGKIELSNLRPICATCNGRKGMGTMHMYEYMFTQKKAGCVNLLPTDPEVQRVQQVLAEITHAKHHLETLYQEGHLTKLEVKKYQQQLNGRRKRVEERLVGVRTILALGSGNV